MSKNWKFKPQIPPEIGEKLSEYPLLIRQLLYNRGLTDKNQITDFLNPSYENLHSPFLFKEMQKAVDRVWQAIDQNQPITIYGDYDADAVTANTVLQQTFRYLGVEVTSYIPDRFTEGYGINLEALRKIADGGTKLIITVDCGTNSIDAADFCNQNNIGLIITDHHEIIGEKPKAYALVNPKNPDDSYPETEITGVGVAFKLACGMLSDSQRVGARLARPTPEDGPLKPAPTPKDSTGWEKWLLDLVAIGTVADCHSLLGENRILVKYGLKVLQKTRWPGLRAIIKTSGLDFAKNPPDTYTLGFVIAPRLNAAGRLEHADAALHLLMENDPAKAMELAENLEKINFRRQEQTARMVSEAKEHALLLEGRKIIVIAKEEWNKGVVGLVAGRLAEEFYKPVIVLEKTAEFSTGSARTAGEFDILEALKFSSEHLVRFGGHKQAAGLTLETKNLEVFYQKILLYAENNLPGGKAERVLELEAELQTADLTLETCALLNLLEPFGVNNPKPKFLISALEIVSIRQVGAKQQHAQMQLKKDNKTISSIAFNFNPLEKNYKVGDTINVAGELMEDGWNGRREVKIKINDVKNEAGN